LPVKKFDYNFGLRPPENDLDLLNLWYESTSAASK